MAELLLELLSEEIPARMQARASVELESALVKALTAVGLAPHGVSSFITPRRMGLSIADLPEQQLDRVEERRGPRVGAPEAALEGFLRGIGLDRDALSVRGEGKNAFHYAMLSVPGRPTAQVLAELVPAVLLGLSWPKSMRWGAASGTSDSLRWVRPLQAIVCLLDGAVVPLALAGVPVGAVTRGHRFMSDPPFPISSVDDYRVKMRLNKVLLDPAERMKKIATEADKLAQAAGLTVVEDAGLLAENAGLTEWPVVLLGRFDARFLEVPREVIQLTMRTNQKYFALNDAATGQLANAFLCVANIEAPDGGAAIVAGNERVLAARLSDARFFWDQDSKTPLESFLPRLEGVRFHEKLGSMGEKARRVAALARHLAETVGADPEQAERAGLLAKADLVSAMVGEFPELQGIMGGYYAALHGEDPAVAEAIAQHYQPVGPSDVCPSAPVAVAVALADKLDTLVQFFAIGEKPTGSKDPFALRRAALGVIRLIVENGLRLDFGDIIKYASSFFNNKFTQKRLWENFNKAEDFLDFARKYSNDAEILNLRLFTEDEIEEIDEEEKLFIASCSALHSFLIDRLTVQQREAGVRHDLIAAAVGIDGGADLVRLLARVKALAEFLDTEDGANLLAGYRRAANILAIEEKKDGAPAKAEGVDAARFVQPAEGVLFDAVGAVQDQVSAALAGEDFTAAMASLATLRGPVDRFFADVMVNADEAAVRANRLALLAKLRAVMHKVADFSKLEG